MSTLPSSPKKPPSKSSKTLEPTTKKRISKSKKQKKKSLLEQITPVVVVIVPVLLAYGGGRYIRTSIHEWVDNAIRRMLPQKNNGAPRLWAITPDSTGLMVDASIYQQFLGSELFMLEKRPPPIESEGSCVYLFLEVTPKTPKADMHKDWAPLARHSKKSKPPCRIMAMANTDQFTTNMLELPHLELILCKTRQCVEWIQQKQEERAEDDKNNPKPRIPILYTGFTSRPPPAPTTGTPDDNNRFNKFLHVAGQSPHKGTWTILQAWLQHPQWPQLTITSYKNQMVDTVLPTILQKLNMSKLPPNIHHMTTKLPQQELDALMHSHGVHLCLSGMEGFGHYVNEARAVGALVLTTNHPAMNELVSNQTGILLEATNLLEWTNGLMFGNVGAPELERVMNQVVLPMLIQERKEYGERAKEAFVQDREKFQQCMELFQCYLEKCSGDYEQQMSCGEGCGLTLE